MCFGRVGIFTSAWLAVALTAAPPARAQQSASSGESSEARVDGGRAASASPSELGGSSSDAAASPPDTAASPSVGPGQPSQSAAESTPHAGSAATETRRERVAVVLIGDANEDARTAALAVEQAVSEALQLPSDAALRASLLGDVASEGAIAPVLRDRRALGGTEAEDVPLLGALGDRADAALLLVVRRRAGHRELVAFDVRHRAFFEGTLELEGELDPARVTRFARARARAAASDAAVAEPSTTELIASAEQRVAGSTAGSGVTAPLGAPRETPEEEPEWIEINWPFLLAGALLAGAAAFVIVYTADDGSQPVPTLRFRPGGTP